MPTQVLSTIKYLSRSDIYNEEKPYKIAFDVSNLQSRIRKTNHVFQDQEVNFIDAQPIRSQFSLDRNGFQFEICPTSLCDTDFDDDAVVRSQYFPEIESFLRGCFPESTHIQILGYQRRKRGQKFPASASYDIPTLNPVLYAHADFTPQGAAVRLEKMIQSDEKLQSRDYQLVNVWRVTKEPNRDWPLAMCDYQSVNVDEDIEFSDVIHRDHVGENCMFYANSNHRWYFLDNQRVEDVILFRHTDSRGVCIPFAGHVAFDRVGKCSTDNTNFPRSSIEVKAVVFS